MQIEFYGLVFEEHDASVRLKSFNGSKVYGGEDCLGVFADAMIAGGNKKLCTGARRVLFSEWDSLKYINHTVSENSLCIEQANERILIRTYVKAFCEGKVFRIFSEAENRSTEPIVLEALPVFSVFGLFGQKIPDTDGIYLYKFYNSWYVECQPKKRTLFEYGLTPKRNSHAHNRVYGKNVGGWSTQEELPQAILQDRNSGECLMFQIESACDWYWEIGEEAGCLYLTMSGADEQEHEWRKILPPGGRIRSVAADISTGNSVEKVVGNMTEFRRSVRNIFSEDKGQPVIFNEYMFISWDNPNESRTENLAEMAKEFGCDIYVIDCGWHDEEDAVYPYVGKWQESKKRFPSGLKQISDKIHALGMKFGVWLEPESFGILCSGMNEIYDDGCFFVRNGKRVRNMNRFQLDFRNPKVTGYLDGVIRHLVEECGVDYIKFDYNQNCGPGTETKSDSLGDGLLQHSRAFLEWVDRLAARYPELILENCASGGQRMDAETLKHFALQSTSDQIDYRLYPYIMGNILSAVLPEQAAAWSYPAAEVCCCELPYSEEFVQKRVSDECVVSNMVNALLGRLHLASYLKFLTEIKRRGSPSGLWDLRHSDKAK